MGLSDLTSNEMIRLSQAWLLDGHESHDALATMPTASACLPKLALATRELSKVSMQHQADESKEVLAQLDAEAAELDARHDRKARGLHLLLRALSEVADDPESACHYRDLNRFLFPIGLTVVDLPYEAEVNAIQRLERCLEERQRAALRVVPLPNGGTLEEVLNDWIKTAHALGEVERQRSLLTKEGAPDGVRKAREQWVRVVKTLMSAARLDDVDENTWAKIFQAIEQAEVEAISRRR